MDAQRATKFLLVGNGLFVAAALSCLSLAGVCIWGRVVLADTLKGEFIDSARAAVEAAALTPVQKANLTYELDTGVKLRRLLGSALRIGQSASTAAFGWMLAGYLLRRIATGAPKKRSG